MDRITVIILSFNEEENIRRCVQSALQLTSDIFVIDSCSTDQTVLFAKEEGGNVFEHQFKDWGSQRNWALDNLPLKSDWVFFLDADEFVTTEFAEVLDDMLVSSSDELAGIYVHFQLFFLGKQLKFSYEGIPVLRIVRKDRARWRTEGAREYCLVEGNTTSISVPIRHQDNKDLHEWIMKQNRNASREAVLLQGNRLHELYDHNTKLSIERPTRTFIRRKIYPRLPGLVRSSSHFFYRYFLRRGFLDGYPGFIFCFMHALWFPILIDAKVYEIKNQIQR